ncbi:hypothetical protein MKP05_14710 [Halomonas sp. EGI 63088]|uniref:Neisseria meningitidis TspB protein n=1 Tax=Halomonas flagellata TaxID=2920385 RepID=A0ABS9RX29_9GAMM|nr:virulence factor TspB C-terminal domain-related protein [Halomonas flagellata]MCH4564359.1 hypothetical protein [Halomonas flagellata]
MPHARTLPRYACLAGLVAGLLAPVHALASPSAEIRSIQYAGTSTPTHINTKVRAAYRFSANDPRFYHRLTLAVSRQSIRTGALAALSRGVMHPGVAVAIAAAGWAWSMADGIYEELAPEETFTSPGYDEYGALEQCSPSSTALCRHSSSNKEYGFVRLGKSSVYGYDSSRYVVVGHCTTGACQPDQNGYWPTYYASRTGTDATYSGGQITETFPREIEPVSEADLPALDEFFPGSIIDDLWADDPSAIPQQWQDQISVLPFSNLNPAGQAAPEVHQGVSRWAENMTARMQDEALPHPDPGVSPEGNTAAEEIVDRMDEEPPDFPNEPEPVWNVVEIDELPDYNASIGSGQCPGPHHINFPFFGSISLDWQPACDLASNIRGAVIALGYILGLLIVVGKK